MPRLELISRASEQRPNSWRPAISVTRGQNKEQIIRIRVCVGRHDHNTRAVIENSLSVSVIVMAELRRDDQVGAINGAISSASVFRIIGLHLVGQRFSPIENCAVRRRIDGDGGPRIAHGNRHIGHRLVAQQVAHG